MTEFRQWFENETLARARAALGGPVRAINENALEDACRAFASSGGKRPIRVGIKDTAQIPASTASILRDNPRYVWVTVDRMAPGGRAVDPGLTNPLTCRPMTGSSSGGPVNILAGITDAAIGTDGGGSILGPAMSANLFGIIGAGLGLLCAGERVSSDGFVFRPSLGVISRDIDVALDLLEALAGSPGRLAGSSDPPKTVAVPAPGSVRLPYGSDMAEAMGQYVEMLADAGWRVSRHDFGGIQDRGTALEVVRRSLASADVVMTLEGPVDLMGIGDSITGRLGCVGHELQEKSGKYLLRAANMAGTTAITTPIPLLASGLLVQGRPGASGARAVASLARLLAERAPMPEVFRQYCAGDAPGDHGFAARRGIAGI